MQLTVKGEYDEEADAARGRRTTPAVAELSAGISSVPADAAYYERIRLGELVAAEVERRRLADTDEALGASSRSPSRCASRRCARADAAFDLAFLVARDGVDAFSKAVARVDEAVGDRIALSYVGPAPPYSFAEAELDREPGMGLITGLLTLPLAPVRGTVWIAERLEEQAEELYDESAIRAQLMELEAAARDRRGGRGGDRGRRGRAGRASDGAARLGGEEAHGGIG